MTEPSVMASGSVPPPGALLADFSLEMTGQDAARLEQASSTIPPGTRINMTFLAHEDLPARLMAVRSISRLGFTPVPHIPARRLRSQGMLEEFLTALRAECAIENVLAVGGDPAEPEGPYADALAIMRTGLLQRYGTRHVSVSGYPDGHPDIPGPVLWSALEAKAGLLDQYQLDGTIITQFSFDADPVLAWIEEVRTRGISLPVRVGVPGPAGARRLLAYAARFGVATSAGIARKYGLSLTSLMGTAGPDRFIRALARGYDPGRHGAVKLHFYTFGGLAATSQWVAAFRDAA